jgi:hypothetical protein
MHISNEQRQAMLALIGQWEQSGMRQKDFYQKHNLPSHVFYYWHKRYNNQKAASILTGKQLRSASCPGSFSHSHRNAFT